MNLETIQIMLFDLYDIRNTLSSRAKSQPKSEGSDETVGEALDDMISTLEMIEEEVTP